MIAWERHIDATRDDADALYSRLAAPVSFADGASAVYGFGLDRGDRTWPRRHRPWRRAARLAQPSDVRARRNASRSSSCSTICRTRTTRRWTCSPPCWARSGRRRAAALPAPDWLGAYTEPETGLAVRIELPRTGRCVCATAISRTGSTCRPTARRATRACGCSPAMAACGWTGRTRTKAHACAPATAQPARDVAGRYRCEELDAELTVADAGGVLYGGFSGFLGQGRMETARPGRRRRLGAAVPACARPHTARRLDAGVPARWVRPGRRRRGRLLAGPPPGLSGASRDDRIHQ